jgi:hypothetical protein
MHHKIQIPPLKNFLGIIIVIIISLWIKAELTSESGLFLSFSLDRINVGSRSSKK